MSRAVARRYLVLRHFLAPSRSLPPGTASVERVVDRLGSLQFDPLEIAGRNHDVVLLARIAGYRREMTDELLYARRTLYETYNKGLSIVPTTDLPWHRATWDRAAETHVATTFVEHGELVAELLDRIRRDGPLSATDVEPRASIEWYWRPTNQVRAVLEALAEAGVLGLARRDGNRRVYDLAERLFPVELLAQRPPLEEQQRHRLLSRHRAHGLLGRGGQGEIWIGIARDAATRSARRTELVEAGALVPVAIEGLRGERYLPGDERDLLDRAAAEVRVDGLDRVADEAWATGRPGGHDPGVTFLAPLDPLVWDRGFLRDLYGFDYVWEVYVPEARRRWGYYVLPVLFGDRLVGRIEPRIERRTGLLRVIGLWWEPGFDPIAVPGFTDAFADAIRAHAAFGGVDLVVFPRNARHRPLVGAVSKLLGPRGRVRP
jgi:uncharacterized protein YcaQ